MAKILIVEDDRSVVRAVKDWLEFEHYMVEHVETGPEGLDLMRAFTYDLIILDVNLPRMSGVEVCRQYRDQGGVAPVLMLTGKDTIADKEAGFTAGVDDYLTKPFHMKELSLRLRALLRRSGSGQSPGSDVLEAGELLLDPVSHKLSVRGEEVQIARMEFMLLEFFMRHPGQVFSPEKLVESVWSADSERSSETIRTSIKKIRQKIDIDPRNSLIKNVHGVGYKFEV